MAPQVGLEPTAYRLTAECSTIELLRNNKISQRSILPGSCPPSTFDVRELNFCVRDGNRCVLSAIVTKPILTKLFIQLFEVTQNNIEFFKRLTRLWIKTSAD